MKSHQMMREQSEVTGEAKKLEELEADLLIFGRRQNPRKSLLLISSDGQEEESTEQASATRKAQGKVFAR